MKQYLVRDIFGIISDRVYFTSYHAEEMARALNINYGYTRFKVV